MKQPYINFTSLLSPKQRTQMNKRIKKSPCKYTFVLTREQQQRRLLRGE